MRRMTIIAALLIALGVSSGAWAQTGGYFTVTTPVDLYVQDSTGVVVADRINDTLIYTTSSFFPQGPFTHLFCRFVQSTRDTATATGLSRDSVLFQLQTKVSHESTSVWYTLGATPLVPVASFDTVGGWIEGDAGRIAIVAADSAKSLGDMFRIRVVYVAEEDSISSHCILRSSSKIDPYVAFRCAAIFANYGDIGTVNVSRLITSRDGDSSYTIRGQGVEADNLGRDTSVILINTNWNRGSVQYLFNDNDTGGAQDSLDYRLVYGWSNDKVNWSWLDSSAARSTDSTFFFDTLVIRPFRYFRVLAKPEIGGDSSGTTNGFVYLFTMEKR